MVRSQVQLPDISMKISIACATLSVIASVAARTITVQNHCAFTIWSVHLDLSYCLNNSWRAIYRPGVRDGSLHSPRPPLTIVSLVGLHRPGRRPFYWVRVIQSLRSKLTGLAPFFRWEAPPQSTEELCVPDNWTSGRIWGRRNCDFSKPEVQDCTLGACIGGLECKQPVSLRPFPSLHNRG